MLLWSLPGVRSLHRTPQNCIPIVACNRSRLRMQATTCTSHPRNNQCTTTLPVGRDTCRTGVAHEISVRPPCLLGKIHAVQVQHTSQPPQHCCTCCTSLLAGTVPIPKPTSCSKLCSPRQPSCHSYVQQAKPQLLSNQIDNHSGCQKRADACVFTGASFVSPRTHLHYVQISPLGCSTVGVWCASLLGIVAALGPQVLKLLLLETLIVSRVTQVLLDWCLGRYGRRAGRWWSWCCSCSWWRRGRPDSRWRDSWGWRWWWRRRPHNRWLDDRGCSRCRWG